MSALSAGFYTNAGHLPGNTLEQQQRAAQYVAGKSTDAADARRLLVMLGLIEEPRVRPRNRNDRGQVVTR